MVRRTQDVAEDPVAMEGEPIKWLELIRVRSSVATLEAAACGLRSYVAELTASVAKAEILFLQHALYDGDLAIAIIWRTHEAPRRTPTGALLVGELERLGTVDHAVWIPTPELTTARGE